MQTSLSFLDKFSDEELLDLVHSISDEIDEKLQVYNNCKTKLEERGWKFVNWPAYEKITQS